MKKLKKPTSHFAVISLVIALFIFAVDLSELLSQSLIVIPIYHTGTLYVLWSDYIMLTAPVGCVWAFLAYGFWSGSS
jgi:hypothetical protein